MQTKTRIVGSGFTTFTWQGTPIAFLDEIHDSGQPPITQYQAVTPLDASFPVEFALPRVKSEGTLQLVIRELWNQPAWWQLAGLAGTYNIIDVYNRIASTNTPIVCSTLIKMPTGGYRGWVYNNVVLVAISDSEDVSLGLLTYPRNIHAVYANKTPLNVGAS